ncbi:MAG: hypothetical protein EA401_02215 [Planctomycetota bacterium]|nr:MAG: hypothetical protein EA401_02210 [Planctomycetota bacterium]TVR15836.1 MAG: hypothetical protein EA401_02215 [Planctomycetota bacterium]
MKTLNETVIRAIIHRVEQGGYLSAILEEKGISYKVWRKALEDRDINWQAPRGRKVNTYTREVLLTVQKRARAGEFIEDICKDLGLLYPNMCRACRRAGIRILDKAALRANIKRRDYSKPRRIAGQPAKRPHIYAALEKGASVKELIQRFDITRSYAILCRQQYHNGEAQRIQERHRQRQQRNAHVVALRKQGCSLKEIGRQCGISPQYISYLLKNNQGPPQQ